MPLTTISRCGGAAAPTFAATVLTVAAAGDLRGYWRLGEAASPFADSSGWVSGPSPMSRTVDVIPYTTQVTGALPAPQDDGAIRLNAPTSGGDYLQAPNGMFAGVPTSWSACAWVSPLASATAIKGGIFSNQGLVAGSPSHTEGWALLGEHGGGVVTAKLSRWVANVEVSASAVIATGSYSFLVATYDGTTSSLYVNGALAATQADARAMTAAVAGAPTIGSIVYTASAVQGQFYGSVDEVAFWGVTLNASQVATLYAAGI